MGDAYIIDAVRTPRGRGKADTGALSSVHPQELLAQVLNAIKDRTGIDPSHVEDMIAGCVSQASEQGACIARNAVLAAGWPNDTTGVSLNRFCGSGQQAVNFAAMGVASGMQDLVIGGGVESMSRVPMGTDGSGLDGKNAHLLELHPIVPQGISADLIATREEYSREDLDAFAARSQERCAIAQKEGRFDKSLIPVTDLEGKVLLDRDEHPRAGTSVESLAGLPLSFEAMGGFKPKGWEMTFDEAALSRYPEVGRIQHVHHAERYVKEHGLKPRARIRMAATAGAEPVIMLTAPGPVTTRCLDKAGLSVSDIDLFEINEAFAAVPLKTMRDLDIDPDKVNVNGGAIALGHPLGATGGMLIGTLLDELERRDLERGLVAMCIGGGMGTATIVERV